MQELKDSEECCEVLPLGHDIITTTVKLTAVMITCKRPSHRGQPTFQQAALNGGRGFLTTQDVSDGRNVLRVPAGV